MGIGDGTGAGMGGKSRILVFASGDKEGGGSGFQELVEFTQTDPPILNAKIVGVVSNHENGGVRKRADQLHIEFSFLHEPSLSVSYQREMEYFGADCAMLSGWLKLVKGLDPARTISIHPGPLPLTAGLHGSQVHEAVMAAYRRGELTQSAVTMHFVTAEYDEGPAFFELPVLIRPDDTPETLAKRVNEKERAWQAYMLNEVVHGKIRLSGEAPNYRVWYAKENERFRVEKK